MIIKLKDLINENEAEHRDTLMRTGFWGKRAAGCLIISKDTGKVLVPFRSAEVQQPHTWGTLGGAIDENEDPVTAVKREVVEEVGYDGRILKIIPLYVFKKKVDGGGEFQYHNFLVIVEKEFEPKLNWETDYCKWVTMDQLESLEPKHFGLVELLKRSSDIIQKEIGKSQLTEVYEDWKGNWIHYSKQPQITINPQQFHSDIAGIYLFPEKFDPMPHWKTYPYKFIVSVPNNMRILDLGKIKENEWADLIKKLNLEKHWKESSFFDKKDDSFRTHFSDDMWDFLKNEYSLKPGKWNSDFRKLGYDAIFDDTKSVHIKEDQLIVLDPRIIKVLKMEQRSGSGFEGVKMVTDRILGMLKNRKGFLIKNDPKKDQYGEIKSFIKFSNLPEDNWGDENYRYITFTISTRKRNKDEKTPHIIGVSVSSTPGRSYGVGAQYSTLEKDWKDVDDLKKEIDWVLSSKEKYAIAEGYIGNCVSILDDTSCPWNDATEMAGDVEENGEEITKEEFDTNIKDPHIKMIKSLIVPPLLYGRNRDKGIYWILDNKDIHWFFKKDKILENRGDTVEVSELYHVTPSFNVENILKNGLEPRNENKLMIHDKAIYFVSSDIDAWNIAFQLNKALVQNKKIKYSTDFTILKIDKSKLPNIKLYKDLQSIHEAGILTYESIPPDAISVYEKLPADVLLGKNYRKFYKFRHFTGERGKPYPTLNEVYEDWKGNWIHYSREPYVKINPKQFHADLSGIYLFPEKFKPREYWMGFPYKFIVSVPHNMNILDLGKMKLQDCIEMLDRLGVDVEPREMEYLKKSDSPADYMWDMLKNHYTSNYAKWNSDFRKLGYDAVFDDTKSIHSQEDQLIVLNPTMVKTLDMEKRSGSGFEELNKVMDRIFEMLRGRKGYLIKDKPKKSVQYGEEAIRSFIKFSNMSEDQRYNDDYRQISFSISTRKKYKGELSPRYIDVSVNSTPSRNYGVGASYSILEGDWSDIDDLKKEIDWVFSNKEKYAIAEGYIGNCVSVLDDTSCPWNDATEMAYDVEENGIKISKEDFLKNVKDPHLKMITSMIKPIEYGKNEDKGIYWILDSKDIHWFFKKDGINEDVEFEVDLGLESSWLDPHGKVYPLEGDDHHHRWAERYFNVDEQGLINRGWIRVVIEEENYTNYHLFAEYKTMSPSQRKVLKIFHDDNPEIPMERAGASMISRPIFENSDEVWKIHGDKEPTYGVWKSKYGIDDFVRNEFTCGACYALAYILHKKTGWPMFGEFEKVKSGMKQKEDNLLRHIWVVNPKGKAIDINGIHKTNYARTKFSDPNNTGDFGIVLPVKYGDLKQPKTHVKWAEQLVDLFPKHFGLK